jgi:hypothetical protein
MLDNVLRTVPLWVAGAILALLCIVTYEVAWILQRRLRSKRKEESTRTSEGEAHIIGAIFALFAFMVSLTFSIAVQRFDDRRGWVAQEANAISTAYLRADLFDEPSRTRLQVTLRNYARSRIAPDGITDVQAQELRARSRQLRGQLWEETRTAVNPVRTTELGALLVEGVNNMIELGSRREWAGMSHIPDRIINALIFCLMITSAVLGHLASKQQRGLRISAYILIALFASAIVIVLDLDRPRSGTIKVSEEPLEQIVADLNGSG